ncbi:hypothetical protein [Saccharopolyspora taberi]|uniref:Uncharacterized protein n=1 Tax=Saccharopolyspora taberi TaxID=60895 RepID=A0ABN3VGK3_9PSEU
MSTTAARRAWDALNDRQKTWLVVIYEADQEAERLAKGAWHRGERSRPASVWRWLEYGVTDNPLSSGGPSGQLQHALNRKKVWDQGAGSTIKVLAEAGLIQTRGEPIGLGATLLWIKLNKAGRAAARAGGADDAAPARRRPKGLLSETLWKMFAEVWRAGETGLKRRWAEGAWEALSGRDLITIGGSAGERLITVSDTGVQHYRDHWADYARMYPAINAPHPDPQAAPIWPKQVDKRLDELAAVCHRIGGHLRRVSNALAPVEKRPEPGAAPTPEWAEAAVLAQERHDLYQREQDMLAAHRDQLHELYRQAVARYAAVAAAVVTAASNGDDLETVLDTTPVDLDDRGLAPDLPCPKTGLDGVDRDIVAAHRAAVKGPKPLRRREERRWEAEDSPGGRALAAVARFAGYLHDLASHGQLTRLLLRRGES